jgi:hypothetical protein
VCIVSGRRLIADLIEEATQGMAKVILVGADTALLEGLAQTLLGLEHDVLFATTVEEAAVIANDGMRALTVVSTAALEDAGVGATLPLSLGSALIVYGASHDERPFLPTRLQRATLAHLVLPLERHRLVALIQSFENRSRTTGRSTQDHTADDFLFEL